MIQQTIPRVVLAGTHSGCGKTTVMCALLQAFADRRLRVASFKCGPDYIDPMFHSRIIGAKSSNLDSFFFQRIPTAICWAKMHRAAISALWKVLWAFMMAWG